MSSRIEARRRDPSVAAVRLAAPAPPARGEPSAGAHEAFGPRWIPWIFAAKTTAAGLLALLVAFAFDLDQPKWSLLTVFIIAQPQSGYVLAKGFYRIVGTVVGAAVALFLVSLFAQERVLFLGALAAWVGLCTFASVLGRNFAAYAFVLSGYTVAIVGIPGALDANNAFFIAVARVTEISLGIMAAGVVSHVVLPVRLADQLRRRIAEGRASLGELAVAVLARRDATALRSKLLEQVIVTSNLQASAVFEDREIRSQSGALRALTVDMLRVVEAANLLDRSLKPYRGDDDGARPGLLTHAASALSLWRGGALDAAGLQRQLVRLSAELPLVRDLCRERVASDEEILRGGATIGLLREFGKAVVAFARTYEAFPAAKSQPSASRFTVANDHVVAAWA